MYTKRMTSYLHILYEYVRMYTLLSHQSHIRRCCFLFLCNKRKKRREKGQEMKNTEEKRREKRKEKKNTASQLTTEGGRFG